MVTNVALVQISVQRKLNNFIPKGLVITKKERFVR